MSPPAGWQPPVSRDSRAESVTDGYGMADLHLHSLHSDGLASIQELLDFVQQRTPLDVIAITDHDDLSGSLAARELVARGGYSFEVVTGMEVTTLEGHLLGLFLERPVRPLRRVEETILEIHAAGGLCAIPHPMSWLTHSIGQRAIRRVMARPEAEARFDAIEIANPSLAGRVTQRRTQRLNTTLGLAEVGGSDAHFLPHIGMAYTLFPGRDAAALRRGLASGSTSALLLVAPDRDRVSYGEFIRQQVRSLLYQPTRTFLRQRADARRARS